MPVLLLVGCWNEKAEEMREERVRDAMVEHWASGEAARDAIVAGDLDEARKQGRKLAERLPLTDLKDLDAVQLELKSHATALADARDLERAALALGAMGATCGRCHAATGGGPAWKGPPPPPAGAGIAAEMVRHDDAAARMWMALVTADDAAFDAAVADLGKNPLVPSGTEADSPLPPLATELEVRVHDLAGFAARADDPVDRGDLYGRMLGTCAACHTLVR